MSYVSVEAISVAVVRAHARGPRRNCTVRTDLASASYLNDDACALQFHRPLLPVARRQAVVPVQNWIHEIKHDGYRLMARRDPVGIRLLTRNGHDWAARYPLIVEAVNHLKVRSVLIDGDVVCCNDPATERNQRLSLCLRPAGARRQ